MVSEYAIGEHGWVLTLCFTALAVGCLCLSLALFPHVTSLLGRIGLLMLVAAAIGLTIAAFNPTDPAGGIMGPAVPVGRPNRLLMVAYAAWIMLAASPPVVERNFMEGAH